MPRATTEEVAPLQDAPPAPEPQAEIEKVMDKAIRAGASIEDLERLMAEHALTVNFEGDKPELVEEGAAPEPAEGEAEEGAEAAAPVRISHGFLASIMERVGGNLLKGKSYANWLKGKRNKVVGNLADDEAIVKENKRAQDEWLKRQQKRAEKTLAWMDWLLQNFTLDIQEKKVDLPAGMLAWQKSQVESEWDDAAAVRFVMRMAFAEGKRVLAETSDREKSEAAMMEMPVALLTVKRDPVKELLTKREDGTRGYVSEDGEPVTVISVHEKGETPVVPGTRDAQPWVKADETYHFVIK